MWGANSMNVYTRRMKSDDTVPYELLLMADESKKLVEEYLGRGDCYLAFADTDETKPIGVYVLIRTRPSTVEIVNIAVDEPLQGRGIGKRLVCDAIEQARSMGAETVEIGTGNSGIVQLALYQKCGFRVVGVDRDFFLRHYEHPIIENGIPCVDMIRLRLELT
jgi:ribosomal protein S18 acetylase RimI-like enzyme